ncbi:anthranilate synthase component II [Alteromonas oceanisediminis]|uniref:anthranilate synthase component II n=1 Tax=Alteromonas oceanisediminis TaxID=2836180 RepID=UPI001BDACCE9|nr:aminodeoxychorismate/anthranilate synthase component II [Alteromonas oceanisediminis]MBT0586105.1 aminodeoxychorismate/anthranilate synthase component II [Alteromonas oceanisediminis]
MLLLIDNYDSFTHNLARYFVELGESVKIVRNDQLTCNDVARLQPDYIVLSPGPCTPDQAGVSLSVVEKFAGQIPLLGVCLGHQAIAQVYGGKIVRAKSILHGKVSSVRHADTPLFTAVNNPFVATRYHSLVAEPATFPSSLQKTAWVEASDCTEADEIMAFEHSDLPVYGVQFHPESLLTEQGHQILSNFLHHPQNTLL